MTEHTQGSFVAFVKHGVICVHLEKDDSPHLTEVIAWPGFDSCDIESHDEQVANAYLFAAAPELLIALKRVEWIDDGDSMGKHCPWCGWYEHAGHADDCLRQFAIAKARGEVT